MGYKLSDGSNLDVKNFYTEIFSKYHRDKSKYNNEHMFGLRKVINSGPYEYELSMTKTTNHLSDEENQQFTDLYSQILTYTILNGT